MPIAVPSRDEAHRNSASELDGRTGDTAVSASLQTSGEPESGSSDRLTGSIEVAAVRIHFGSPVQMLMRESLGSERRSRLLSQIAHSGPTELASLATFAAATGDKELGAALCTRASSMPANERPFSSQDLADALVGETYRNVTRAIMEVDRIAAETVGADTAFETGRTNLTRNLQSTFMRRDEEAVGGDLSDLDALTAAKEEE